MTAALVPGLLLTMSALALGGERHWVLPFAVIAGWSGVVGDAGRAPSPRRTFTRSSRSSSSACSGRRTRSSAARPRLDWRRLAAAPTPTPTASDRYDGTIEEI